MKLPPASSATAPALRALVNVDNASRNGVRSGSPNPSLRSQNHCQTNNIYYSTQDYLVGLLRVST